MVQSPLKSRLVEKIPRVADIVSFRFERPEGYEFEAGQWFVVNFGGPEEMYSHHFSHSNSPLEPVLEFTTRLRDTEFKRALDALPLRAEVELEGPYGAFTLPDDRERVAFITGGIGITCVRSMLLRLADGGGAARDEGPRTMVLLFANHSEDAIPFMGELARLEEKIPGLRVVHVIGEPGEGWRGHKGRIDRGVFDSELHEPGQWAFLVSGAPAFGQSIREELLAWDVQPASIKVDRFDGY